jgi:hypothetical protein
MIGQGMKLAMDQIYKATLGTGQNALFRQGDASQMTPLDLISLATMGLGTGAIGAGAKTAKQIATTGRRTLAEEASAIHRSQNPNLKAMDPSKVKTTQGNMWGPGTYFYKDPETSALRGADYGSNLYGIKHNPISAMRTLGSKGYIDALDAAYNRGISLSGKSLDSQVIKDLMKEGYVGVKEPNTGILTNWNVGTKLGPKLKKVTPKKAAVKKTAEKKSTPKDAR